MGGVGGGFYSIWDPSCPGHFLQVPRGGSLGGRKQLTGGGTQPTEGTAEMGEVDAGIEQGGGG